MNSSGSTYSVYCNVTLDHLMDCKSFFPAPTDKSRGGKRKATKLFPQRFENVLEADTEKARTSTVLLSM